MNSTQQTGGKLVWRLQILLAVVFLFAGGSKFAMSDEALTTPPTLFSALFIRFIGVCEVLGAAGLVLPMQLHIRPGLTPVAAACLIVIMIGATVTTVMTMPIMAALVPLVIGVLLAYVAYSRWPLLRAGASSPRSYV